MRPARPPKCAHSQSNCFTCPDLITSASSGTLCWCLYRQLHCECCAGRDKMSGPFKNCCTHCRRSASAGSGTRTRPTPLATQQLPQLGAVRRRHAEAACESARNAALPKAMCTSAAAVEHPECLQLCKPSGRSRLQSSCPCNCDARPINRRRLVRERTGLGTNNIWLGRY